MLCLLCLSLLMLTILGARPQFIKAAAFSNVLKNYNKTDSSGITEKILHTGQHYNYELPQQIIEQLGIPLPWHSVTLPKS